MKIDFNTSNFVKLWDSIEGANILRIILQNPDMIRTNYGFYKQKFKIDPNITKTQADGSATFKSEMRQIEKAHLAHLRAPLGDTITAQKGNGAFYTGVIPDIITDGFSETAMEREDKERRFKSIFGNDDSFFIQSFAEQVQVLKDSADMTLSNHAAQMLSKGLIYHSDGEGSEAPLLKAAIPKENFSKAGEKVWNDPDCMLLDQMAAIEKKYQDLWGVSYPMQWEIEYEQFRDVFLKNKQVIDLVKSHRFFNNQTITDNMTPTEAMFREAIADYPGGLSPIVIVNEKQFDMTGKAVKGWKDGVAVYRPRGYAGLIRHTENLDRIMAEKYGNKIISQVFSTTNDGLYTVANITMPNGKYKEWHTHLMYQAIPTLDEFLYHVCVDTKTAGK